MKIPSFVFLGTLGVSAVFLSGCSTGDVLVLPQPVAVQTSKTYTPIPISDVRVSSHPPKGRYQIIDLVFTEANVGEPLDSFLRRLRTEAAHLGGNYVWVIGAEDDSEDAVEAPKKSAPAPATGLRHDQIASAYAPRHVNSRTAMTAGILKIISGTNEPDLSQPAWVLR